MPSTFAGRGLHGSGKGGRHDQRRLELDLKGLLRGSARFLRNKMVYMPRLVMQAACDEKICGAIVCQSLKVVKKFDAR